LEIWIAFLEVVLATKRLLPDISGEKEQKNERPNAQLIHFGNSRMNSRDWILPKGCKGVLMMRANRKSEESAPRAGSFLEDAGEYGQSVGDIVRRIAHHILLIHISEPWVMMFTVGSRQS
jgi:hypothetical protein